nr:MAG: hypothetical protein 2 [Byreska virus]
MFKQETFLIILCIITICSGQRHCFIWGHPECFKNNSDLHIHNSRQFWTVNEKTPFAVCNAIKENGGPKEITCENNKGNVNCNLCFLHSFLQEWERDWENRKQSIMGNFFDLERNTSARCALNLLHVTIGFLFTSVFLQTTFILLRRFKKVTISHSLDSGIALIFSTLCLLMTLIGCKA